MNQVRWAVVGLLLSLIYVLTAGLLSIQISGLRGGVVYNPLNAIVGVQPPSVPLIQVAAVAALNGIVIYVLLVATRSLARPKRLSFLAGIIAGNVALIVTGMAMLSSSPTAELRLDRIARGFTGWLMRGCMDPAVHAVTILAAGAAWWLVRSRRAGAQRETLEVQ